MIKIGGVVYRNIQEQVAKNTQDIAKIQRKPVLQVKKVDELPEEGEEGILYLLPASDPEIGNYFEEYLWIDSAWELIGSSAVDISNMCTTDTDQTITGIKTFSSDIYAPEKRIRFNSGASQSIGYYSASYSSWGAPNGGVFLGNNEFKPSADNTMDLGTSSNYWKRTYTKQIRFDDWTYIGQMNSDLYMESITGHIRLNANLRPSSDNSKDLGSSNFKWKDLYLGSNIYFSSIATIETLSDRVKAKYNGVDGWEWGGNSYRVFTPLATAAVYPTSDGQKDIGLSSQRYKDVYLSGNISDGANSASVADIAALITYAKAQGWIS